MGIRISYVFFAIGFVCICYSCREGSSKKERGGTQENVSLLQARFSKLLEYPLDANAIPRSFTKEIGKTRKVTSADWTSGFFPGNLWLLYRLTQDSAYLERAEKWTAFIQKEQFNDKTHDTGFMINCSFGNGLQFAEKKEYEAVVLQTAKTLSTRYRDRVGCIRSWDFNADEWDFPVIIDNMMNLELLFKATALSGDSTYYKIADTHARTTMANHFRADFSTYHVVDYDTITGAVRKKQTHQGHDDGSSWARGQSWAIYGYTMAYRFTQNKAYLERAKAAADYFLTSGKLPADGVPYWDFKDPKIPDAPRDVSAAAITASALYDLHRYTDRDDYIDYADAVVTVLEEKYLLEEENNSPFLLDHSTGNKPKSDEIDEPIVYADYYFLEALVKKRKLLVP
ncbi:glycoside hydrolase family 88 protein [Maribacter sp. 2-571]|uniref:glycoside hydrolase family 88 protein n=1 Tax=Maribacter sp. 2-571 TaxID=3417569 RepID=UPI003D34E9D0